MQSNIKEELAIKNRVHKLNIAVIILIAIVLSTIIIYKHISFMSQPIQGAYIIADMCK